MKIQITTLAACALIAGCTSNHSKSNEEHSALVVNVIDKTGENSRYIDSRAKIYIDGEFVGSPSHGNSSAEYRLSPGNHTIKAVTQQNHSKEVKLRILSSSSKHYVEVDCTIADA